jgi:hypothetical protein
MQSDRDRAVARRFFTDAWNPRDLTALKELFPPTFTMVAPGGKAREMPVSFVADTIECWHEGFDGFRYDIDHEATTEDGTVLFFTTFSGTHTGRFQWLNIGPWEPTGRPVAGYETFAFGVSDGQITRMAALWDPTHLAAQLGVAL